MAFTLISGKFFANSFAFVFKNSKLISIGIYSFGFSKAIRSFFIFLFEPLPNSIIEALSGEFFLKKLLFFSRISNSDLVG